MGGKGIIYAGIFRKRLANFLSFTWCEKHEFSSETKVDVRTKPWGANLVSARSLVPGHELLAC